MTYSGPISIDGSPNSTMMSGDGHGRCQLMGCGVWTLGASVGLVRLQGNSVEFKRFKMVGRRPLVLSLMASSSEPARVKLIELVELVELATGRVNEPELAWASATSGSWP